MLSLATAIPTFVCSVLSFCASTTFAIFYWLYPPERHFRQALIVNLLIADWINSLNNSISGAVALYRRNQASPLNAGPACTANGYIGQFSVQAIDFSILVISLSVLLTVRHPRFVIEPPWWQVVCVCAIPWIPPIITANIALVKNAYGPVSGNWCWITANHFGLRYALTHGWRIAIFVTTIGVYTYIYIFLMRAYGRLGVNSSTGAGGTAGSLPSGPASNEKHVLSEMPLSPSSPRNETTQIRVRSSITTTYERDEEPLRPKNVAILEEEGEANSIASTVVNAGHFPEPPGSCRKNNDNVSARMGFPSGHTLSTAATRIVSGGARQRKQAVRKMLLLNGYPILYVILWIPGITTRIFEAFGPAPEWLKGMQASTQLVGFANALTYAYNEQLLQRMRAPRTSRW